jgi:hypothetical protein
MWVSDKMIKIIFFRLVFDGIRSISERVAERREKAVFSVAGSTGMSSKKTTLIALRQRSPDNA